MRISRLGKVGHRFQLLIQRRLFRSLVCFSSYVEDRPIRFRRRVNEEALAMRRSKEAYVRVSRQARSVVLVCPTGHVVLQTVPVVFQCVGKFASYAIQPIRRFFRLLRGDAIRRRFIQGQSVLNRQTTFCRQCFRWIGRSITRPVLIYGVGGFLFQLQWDSVVTQRQPGERQVKDQRHFCFQRTRRFVRRLVADHKVSHQGATVNRPIVQVAQVAIRRVHVLSTSGRWRNRRRAHHGGLRRGRARFPSATAFARVARHNDRQGANRRATQGRTNRRGRGRTGPR